MRISDNAREEVQQAIESHGFDDLRSYMLDRTGWSLTQMADDLGIKHPTFFAIHNEWVDKSAPDPWGDDD